MKKRSVAIYPGSFNPFHEGHKDIVKKALEVFDIVIVAQGINPEKYDPLQVWDVKIPQKAMFTQFDGLLVDFARKFDATCIIKGIRNSKDMEDEMAQQEWNRELGLEIPTLYIISEPEHRHISSSAIRAIKKIKGVKS